MNQILIRRVLAFFIAYRPECPHIEGTGNTVYEALGHLLVIEARNNGDVSIKYNMKNEYTHSYVAMNGLDVVIV